MKALFVVLSQFLLLVTGTSEFTDCPTYSLCINEPVSYQCSVDISGSANALQWRVLNTTGGILGVLLYGSGSMVGSSGSIETQFTTNLTSTGDSSIVSDITFSATMDINNYTVQCRALDTNTPSVIGTATCSIILIQGVLYQPTVAPNISAINPNNYTISWLLSTNRCIISYTVFINSPVGNSSYENVPANTGLVVDTPQFNDTVYTISVAAVDTVGRQYRDPVDEIMLIIDEPESVTNLTLNQTGLSIDVSWNEPPDSPRPDIISYIIYPDVSNTNNMPIPTPTTTHNIPDATIGSVYTVGVAAVNSLGTGDIESMTIMILSTSTTSTISFLTSSTFFTSSPGIISTVVTTSSSMIVSFSTVTTTPSPTSLSDSFTEPSVTPSTSPTPPDNNTGELNSTVYIGIGVGAAVIVIVIILIIVGCLIWCKPWKREKANFNQSKRDSTEPIALVDKKDHGSSPATGQPIYQEAMSSEDIQREAAPTTGELYAQPSKASIRRPPPQPQSELATYQDPSTIQRTQAPNTEYLYAEVDKKPQQQAVYAQVDKEKKGGDGTVYADLDLKNAHGGPVSGSNPANVIYSDVHNN